MIREIIKHWVWQHGTTERLVAIVSPDSAPIKRRFRRDVTGGCCIDATYGRKTRSVVIMDSDHIILSAIQPDTVAARLNGKEDCGRGGEPP